MPFSLSEKSCGLSVKGSDFSVPKYENVIHTINSNIAVSLEDTAVKSWLMNHSEEIDDVIAEGKARKEELRLMATQAKNERLRNLVKHVHWSGNTCIVYWNDGTQTKSHWTSEEPFDAEKAILVCMARKLYENTNLYNEVLHKYESDGYAHNFKEMVNKWDLG